MGEKRAKILSPLWGLREDDVVQFGETLKPFGKLWFKGNYRGWDGMGMG